MGCSASGVLRKGEAMNDTEYTRDASTVEISTRSGRVRGFWRGAPGAPGASAAFLGIPFAQPPVGSLRFAAPIPPAPWEGVLDATAYGATPQRGDQGVTLTPEPSVPGESTLNVNVFTPSPEPAEGLPVLVYIHGGAYVMGSPANPWYEHSAFARDGVVTVIVSYRLGFDGFGWIEDAPLNRGVLDWLLALEWVRENIAAFGGDPGRVTIAGQSAGGDAVLRLLTIPAAQHLFHRVWALSAATADISLDEAEAVGRRVAAAGGVAPTMSGFSAISPERLLELAGNEPDPLFQRLVARGRMDWGPVIDGDLITRPRTEAVAAGVGADKELVLGTTDDEFVLAAGSLEERLAAVPAKEVLDLFGFAADQRDAYLAANRDVVARGATALAVRVISDTVCRALLVALANARGSAPTWMYRFSYSSSTHGGAVHCIDIPFFLDVLECDGVEELTGPRPPQSLADEIHPAAVAFLRDGDPGWPSWSGAPGATRIFDVESEDSSDGYASLSALLSENPATPPR
jgi:para-nitrobenzyl esterase